jgi:cytoskeletal protein RodZ
MFDKLADELREQREKSGLTLPDMATKTRIDLKFLEAIDQGNFSFLPELYVKAFIKQYAKAVGLDETEIIKKYEAAKEGIEYNPAMETPETKKEEPVKTDVPKPVVKPVSALKSYVEEHSEKKAEDNKKQNKLSMILGAAASVIVLVFLVLYVFVLNKSDKIIVEETPIDEVIEQQNKQRYIEDESVDQIEESTANYFSADSLYLTISATETSWVFVLSDNKKIQEYTLSPNSKITFAALNNFKATIGNSGGISLYMNNKAIEFAGRSGSVKHIQLDRNGLIYLNAPPKLEQQ